MNEFLLIHLVDDTNPAWIPTDARGQPLGTVQSGSLVQAASMSAGRRVVVLVPSERVPLHPLKLPGVRGDRLRQAVPFALEDTVVGELDDIHFATGPVAADGTLTVAVVGRAQMGDWLASLRDAGINPEMLIPDCLALPYGDSRVWGLVHGARLVVRDGPVSGYACTVEHADSIARVRGGVTDIAVISGEQPPASLSGADPHTLRDGILPLLAPQAVATPMNLLQGSYRRTRHSGDTWRPWRVPLALAAALAVVMATGWLLEYNALKTRHTDLQAEVAALFRTLVPDEPMVDPRAQVERRTGGAGSDTLIRLLDPVSASVAAVPGVRVSALSYRGGTMELTVATQRAEQLEALRAAIEQEGRVQVVIDGASSRGDQVEGRLSVSEPGA